MTETYEYCKARERFGRNPQFINKETSILGVFESMPELKSRYLLRNPTDIVLSNIPEKSEHRINTDRVDMDTRKMRHVEGGWPENVDFTEPQETKKYKKRVEKDTTDFNQIIFQLVEDARIAYLQNKQVDMYEEYFDCKETEMRSETASTKTLMMFKDKSGLNRAVSSISWNPESPNKISVSYARRNPSKIETNCMDSYIWDLNNPNEPDRVLSPPSPLLCLAYNHKSSDLLAGGCFNGVVTVWDYKRQKVVETSDVEKSHHYSVVDLFWLHGKAGTEFITTSSDGRMLWWDARALSKGPVYEFILGEEGKAYGGTKIEFNPDAANKFLCGTDIGLILLINKRVAATSKSSDITKYGYESGKHHGPLMSVKRNPFLPKYFLSVGDWTAKVWFDDLKIPLITTKYNDVLLTDGSWSSSKPGLFFLTRSDGWLDAWDYYYRQNEPAFSQKISDNYLTTLCIKPLTNPQNPNESNLIAVGDSEGIVNMMELSDSLCCYTTNSQKVEKDALFSLLEREYKREKNLETNRKVQDNKKVAVKKEAKDKEGSKEDQIKTKVNAFEKTFFTFIEGINKGGEFKQPESTKEELKAEASVDTKEPKKEDAKEGAKEEYKEETKEEGKKEENQPQSNEQSPDQLSPDSKKEEKDQVNNDQPAQPDDAPKNEEETKQEENNNNDPQAEQQNNDDPKQGEPKEPEANNEGEANPNGEGQEENGEKKGEEDPNPQKEAANEEAKE